MNARWRLVRHHYMEAARLGLQEVEAMARKILREHRNLDEFVMCMGGCFFTMRSSDHNINPEDYDAPKYMQPLAKFLGEWDDYLKLTGEPMRFTATGKLQRTW